MKIRITGGVLKGRCLSARERLAYRPTTSRNRQMLFNVLRDAVDGGRFLDLFAGSGVVGLEAVSRGAAHAAFVENEQRALAALRGNIGRLGLDQACTVLPGSALRPDRMPFEKESLKIIFMDPPYGLFPVKNLDGWAEYLAPGGVLVYEYSVRRAVAAVPGLTLAGTRKSGDSCFSFFKRS